MKSKTSTTKKLRKNRGRRTTHKKTNNGSTLVQDPHFGRSMGIEEYPNGLEEGRQEEEPIRSPDNAIDDHSGDDSNRRALRRKSAACGPAVLTSDRYLCAA
ncbi:unnamed protein product [Cuscuta epithymum]|uniref:Uncharacterized protein n=1 Tax=Cuscuta epithymum TaxID=186058 RepID=A0AAV0E8V4_9ASTE|nr:unnamed protein product [Cuscuta epithymum]